MKLLQNGNVEMNAEDLETMRALGFTVWMHTECGSYANGIFVKTPAGIDIGFYNWLNNLEFYFDQEYIKITSNEHLQACIAMMLAVNKFKIMS